MIEFKLFNEDEDILRISKELEKINKEIDSLNKLLITFNETTKNQNPLINDLEKDILKLKEDVEKAKLDLEKSEKYNNFNRKIKTFISAGIGSLSGGTIGLLFTPFLGPTVPIVSSILGGITGAIYSNF